MQAHGLLRARADLAVAGTGERQDFLDAFGQAVAIQPAHQAEHQLHGAIGAGSAEAVAVEGEAGRGDPRLRAALGQAGALFGVDTAAIVVQHPGAAEEPRAVPQPAQGHAVGRAIAQQAVKLGVLQWRAQAAADHQQVQLFQRFGGQLGGHQLQPQVAEHAVAFQRQRGELEAVGAQQVGRDQHVHGHGEAGHREVFEQYEIDPIGGLGIGAGGLQPQHVAGTGLLAELAWRGHSGLRFLAGLESVAGGRGKDNLRGGRVVLQVVFRQPVWLGPLPLC
ncbi:hypothetical protein D3C78_493800 [compost metagenome]